MESKIKYANNCNNTKGHSSALLYTVLAIFFKGEVKEGCLWNYCLQSENASGEFTALRI